MPLQFLHNLTARARTWRANRQAGCLLAFVAGAIDAGGFLAVPRHTSHMTGIATAVLVNWARRRGMQGEFALPVIVEAALLAAISALPLIADARTALSHRSA